MPIIYYVKHGKSKIKPTDKVTFIVNFFGILGSIKVNALDSDQSEEQKVNVLDSDESEGQKVNALASDESEEQIEQIGQEKQTEQFEEINYYFDYPYFSEIVNPECFKKEELDNRERRFTKAIVTLWLCSFYFLLLLLYYCF